MDKNKYIHVQVGEDLKKKLRQQANEKGLSLNAYVRMILIEGSK